MKKKHFIVFFVLFASVNVFAQEPSEKPDPVELPNLIIDRVEELNIRGGIKAFPSYNGLLTKSELDSLNSIEKQQSLLLPIGSLPKNLTRTEWKQGYLKAHFGRFTSIGAEAGYMFDIDRYKLFANGGFDISDGHVKNSEYSNFYANLSSDYIAPKIFWIFGGSKTKTNLKLKNSSYYLYGLPKVLERNRFDLDLNIDVEGKYEGIEFNTGAGFYTMQMETDGTTGHDNAFTGYLNLMNNWKDYQVGINSFVDFHSISVNSSSFIQLGGILQIKKEKYKAKGELGINIAGNTSDISRIVPNLQTEIKYYQNKNFTYTAGIRSGLEQNSLRELLNLNPYLADLTSLDFMHNLILIEGFMHYHPSHRLNVNIGLRGRLADRIQLIYADTTGNFISDYQNGGYGEILFEADYELTETQSLYGNFGITFGALSADSTNFPYLVPMKFSAGYHNRWFEEFGTKIGLNYISARKVDIVEDNDISSNIIVSLDADYRLNKSITLILQVNNLVNSDVIVWENYKERGIYAALKLLWQF